MFLSLVLPLSASFIGYSSPSKRQSSQYCGSATGPNAVPTTLSTQGNTLTMVEGYLRWEAQVVAQGPGFLMLNPLFSMGVSTGTNEWYVGEIDNCSGAMEPVQGAQVFPMPQEREYHFFVQADPQYLCDDPSTFNQPERDENDPNDPPFEPVCNDGLSLYGKVCSTEAECSNMCGSCTGTRYYCAADGTCTCDNADGKCWERSECGPIDGDSLTFEEDDACSMEYNDKGCCTVGETRLMVLTVSLLADQIFDIDTSDEEHAECFDNVISPIICAEKCSPVEDYFRNAEEEPVLCKASCEYRSRVCASYDRIWLTTFSSGVSTDGEEGEGEAVDPCADAPTTNCLELSAVSGATALLTHPTVTVMGVVVAAALFM